MDILPSFHNYLSDNNHVSNVTIKNYLADLRAFINWYEASFHKSFYPELLRPELIQLYKKTGGGVISQTDQNITYASILSPKSLKRHLSTLRKFSVFLMEQKIISENPTLDKAQESKPVDYWNIQGFRFDLEQDGSSYLTIKNYISDINHFKQWCEEVLSPRESYVRRPANVLSLVDEATIQEYKDRLQSSLKLSPATINRRLSALRRYFEYAQNEGLIKTPVKSPEVESSQSILLQDISLSEIENTTRLYSSFPPFRLFQRILSPYVVLEEKAAEFVKGKIGNKNSNQKKLITHSPVPHQAILVPQNIKKGFYSRLSTKKPNSFLGSISHTLKHWRPNWYHSYHAYPITHYFHFAVLILLVSIAGVIVYNKIYPRTNSPIYAAEPSRLIPFQGRILDSQGRNVQESQKIRFAIYTDPLKDQNTLLWQETQDNVKVKEDGTFYTLIGTQAEIPEHIFLNNEKVFLGVTIGTGEELKPRNQLASIGHSITTESVQNMLPITDGEASTQNVLLALDSAGNLTIGGSANPTFQASGGEFTMSGEILTMKTNAGTNSNIVLTPDGTGQIDLQKALINTSENGVLNPGSVEVQDALTILTQNELGPSLLISSSGSADLLVASSSGKTQFKISSTGNVGLGTDNPTQTLHVEGAAYIKDWLGVGTLVPTSELDVRGNSALFSGSNDFNLYVSKGTASSSAAIKFQDNLSSKTMMGLLGDDKFQVRVSNNGTDWNNALAIDNSNGNVGVGTTSPGDKLTVAGNIGPSDDLKYNLGSETKRFNKLYVNEIISPLSGVAGYLQRSGTNLTPSTITDSLLLGSTIESNAVIKLSGIPNSNSWISSGNLGIGTTTPAFSLHVSNSNGSGAISQFSNTSTGNNAGVLNLQVGVSTPTASNNYISFQDGNGNTIGKITGNGTGGVTYSTTGSDFAEYFRKEHIDEPMEPGDLVCTGQFGGITRCTDQFPHIVGIISDKAGFVGNSQYANDSTYALVGLSGQLRAKIIQDESIKPGDFLTFSKVPGKAEKIQSAGVVIGKVIEPIGTDWKAQIHVQVAWHDPEMYLASSGDVEIVTDQTEPLAVYDGLMTGSTAEEIRDKDYSINRGGNLITRVGSFFEIAAARIQTGLIETENAIVNGTLVARNIVADTITIDGQPLEDYIATIIGKQRFISPVSEIDTLRTNVISPLDGNGVAINLENRPNATDPARLDITNGQETVATIDSAGNARFDGDIESRRASFSGQLAASTAEFNEASVSGNLTSDSLTSQNATIAGTLTADRIVAKDIEGLNDQIAAITQKNLDEIRNNQTNTTPQAEFIEVSNIKAGFAIIDQGLTAFGPSTFNQASVMDSFSVGTDFVINNGSINVLGSDLEIQPLRQGGVSFLAGLVTIDTTGNMTIQGDLNVNGTLYAKNSHVENELNVAGKLSSNIISPLSESSLSVLLASESANLAVRNASNSAVFGVNSTGDVEASGSATFSKLNFNLVGDAHAVSDTEVVASGSAGAAQVKATKTEVTIYTPHVTEDSLIYITPVGNTNNVSVYLLRQTPQESFTVGVSKQSAIDIPFNWIIIN